MFAARKRKLLERLHAALPAFLEPGERPDLALQVAVNTNVSLVAAAIAAGMFTALVALGALLQVSVDSVWAWAVLGGVVGGTVGAVLAATMRWVVVTDRRVLFLRASAMTTRPTRLDVADARSAATATAKNLTAWGWRSVTYRRPDGSSSTLRANRMWHAELPAFLALVGIPPAPGTGRTA